jgi:hypothetical protein
MIDDLSPTPPPIPPPTGRNWQFSLRSLLMGMTAFSVWCALTVALPSAFSQALIGTVWIAASGIIVTGLFFAKDDQRAFCIGAAIVVSSTWTQIGGRFLQGIFKIFSMLSGGLPLPESVVMWLDLVLITVAAVANGWLCVRARRYFEHTSSD